ncbi:hypothetical protein BGX27_002204 [Mortierella sp. AM989]|nr:hypothetical protein BGX27_002204 [Mortierella sp. AM989]
MTPFQIVILRNILIFLAIFNAACAIAPLSSGYGIEPVATLACSILIFFLYISGRRSRHGPARTAVLLFLAVLTLALKFFQIHEDGSDYVARCDGDLNCASMRADIVSGIILGVLVFIEIYYDRRLNRAASSSQDIEPKEQV